MNTNPEKKFGIKSFETKFGRLTFGKLLESYRLSHSLSAKELASLLNISSSSLCDMEKGRRIPSPTRAAAIAKRLGHSQKLWIQVSLQDQCDEQGLKVKVLVH